MNKKYTISALGIVVAILIIGGIAYVVGKKSNAPQMPASNEAGSQSGSTAATSGGSQSGTTGTTGGAAGTAATGWKTYHFAGDAYLPAMAFEYPSTWEVLPNVYRTVGDQTAGLPGQVASLTVQPRTGAGSIVIGGFQARCGATFPGQTACFKDIPVRAIGTVSASIFTHLTTSLR